MIEFIFIQINKHRKIVKFLIAGTISAGTDLFLLWLFVSVFGMHYLPGSVLAFIMAFFVSFGLHKFWTFRDSNRQQIGRQMTKYMLASLMSLLMNSVLMYVLVDLLHIWYLLSQTLAMLLIASVNFFVYNILIFQHQGEKCVRRKDEPIRVLIATGIFPPDIGGPATMLEALSQGLAEKGMDVKILTYADHIPGDSENKRIIRVKRHRHKIWSSLEYLLRLMALSRGSDVIYATDIYSVGYFAYLTKLATGVPYIIRFAGDSAWETAVNQGWTRDYIVDFQNKEYDGKIKALKIRRTKILVQADGVIAVSDFLAGIAVMIGVEPGHIRTIYNSVDFIEAEPEPSLPDQIRKSYGSEAKIIITICRLTPWKGVDGLIRMLSELRKSIATAVLLVLGDGGEMDNLKKLAQEEQVGEAVHFLGRIRHDDIMAYLQAADLFILNSNYEGLSHVIMEAMKAGTPIVASRVGGNPELIRDGQDGILAAYNDIAGLKAAAQKILADDDLAGSLADSSRIRLLDFDWKDNLDHTSRLIKDICHEKNSLD